MSGSSEVPYRVVRSEKVRDQLWQWAEAANQAGLADQYLDALKTIENKLKNEPLSWGDPLYPFRHLELIMCRGIHWIFLVEYGVHEGKRIVFIKEYRLLPGHSLESGS